MAKKDIAARLADRNAQSCEAALDRAYNSMFGLPTGSEAVVKLPINCLHPYTNDPFKDRSGEEMEQLANSIRENGLQYPVIVRPMEASGQYEILAGRRRTNAMKHNGETEIDAIIREASDDEAVMIVTETNLRCRNKLLPSEKAFAYKLQLDAIKRQGKRLDMEGDATSSDQIGWRSESANIIAKSNDTSKNDIRRHIRLTYLIPPLLELVDAGTIPFIAGVNISYLDEVSQSAVHEFFFDGQCEHMEYCVVVPKQHVTSVRAESELSDEYDPERFLHYMDVHSHNVMPAKFSARDDADEKATRLYAVIGRLQDFIPELSMRISNGGKYLLIDPATVFESFGDYYPVEWNGSVTLHPMSAAAGTMGLDIGSIMDGKG